MCFSKAWNRLCTFVSIHWPPLSRMLSFHQDSCDLILMQEARFDTMIKCLLKKKNPSTMIDGGVLWVFFQSTKQGHTSVALLVTQDICLVRLTESNRHKENGFLKFWSDWVCTLRSSEALRPRSLEDWFLHQETPGVSSCGSWVKGLGVAVSDGIHCNSLQRCKDGVCMWQQVSSRFCCLTSY